MTHTSTQTKIHLAIGSTSPLKIGAVQEACRRLTISALTHSVGAKSGQNAQPIGFEETLKGATTRAFAAKQEIQDSIGIGIESGILRSDDKKTAIDIAIIVIIGAKSNTRNRIITTSQGFEFPIEFVDKAEKAGFETTTVGDIVKKEWGGDANDPHWTLSEETISRDELIVEAVMAALLLAFQPQL